MGLTGFLLVFSGFNMFFIHIHQFFIHLKDGAPIMPRDAVSRTANVERNEVWCRGNEAQQLLY